MKETAKQPTDIEDIIRRLCGESHSSRTPPSTSRNEETPKRNTFPNEGPLNPEFHSQAQLRLQETCTSLEKELLIMKERELQFSEEKALLQEQLEQQKSRMHGESTAFLANCKQLEERIVLLAGERDVFTQKIASLSSQLAEKEAIILEQNLSILTEKTSATDLFSSLEIKKKEYSDLSNRLEALEQKNASLLSQNSLLIAALEEEKSHKDIIAISVKSNQDHMNELRNEIETLHHILQEKDERYTALQHKKEELDTQLREVKELLISKLQYVQELEEEIQLSRTHAEEWKIQRTSLENLVQSTQETSASLSKSIEELSFEKELLKEHLTRANEHILELKVRTASFDQLKEAFHEASSHVRALSSLFGPTPQSVPSLQNLVESFMIGQKQKTQSYN